MFGINDDHAADQTRDQHTEEHTARPVRQDEGRTNSPFAAAYSSLSDQDDNRPTSPAHSADSSNLVPEEDLLQIKTQALASLAPLVNHLNQTPEERFKTTMMMIQASDNAELIRDAYQAAAKIDNEKARAQALLDVINEINYFTQKSK